MAASRKIAESVSSAAAELRRAEKILITGHISPDGDCVGSCLAIALALRSMGKDVFVYSEDPVPYNFSFLPGTEMIGDKVPDNRLFDHSLILDLSEEDRVGKGFPWKRAGFIINVDHHATGPGLGKIVIRDAQASATGELVYFLVKEMKVPFTKEIATNLYCAILTDTGSFHYSNSTKNAFEIAGLMVSAGVEPWEMASMIYECEPRERIALLGLVLSTLEVSCGGKLATLAVTTQMFRTTGATKDMTDQFVNYARSIRCVEVAILLRELPDGAFKASMRSRGEIDVSAIGLKYGGGGHRNAAGCNLPGPLANARRLLEQAVAEALSCKGS